MVTQYISKRWAYISFLVATLAFSSAVYANIIHTSNQSSFNTSTMLLHADDLRLTRELAELPIALGEFEKALATMQPLYFTYPDEPKIAFEMGVLHYLLGAYNESANFFAKAKRHSEEDGALTRKADAYINLMKN